MGLASVVLVAAFLTMAGSAWAEASTYCVKATKVGKKHTGGWTNATCTAVSATHEGKYEKIQPSSLSEPEQQELKALLKYTKVLPSGVGGKPTVQVSGANVQIVNGESKTATSNGAGNLVIGYDENAGAHAQTGSHDLILGEEQTYTSYAGILAGKKNTISAPFASVTGGLFNTASGEAASVSSGEGNTASAVVSSVSGGGLNKATFKEASVSGGFASEASGENASVSGGVNNKATAIFASVSGGDFNTATGGEGSISGGDTNTASGTFSWVGGGASNNAKANVSSIFGGKGFTTSVEYEAIP
jgi:hypothetical protein